METVTVYQDTYRELQSNEFRLMTELATLKGNIIALAEIMKTDPKFVEKKLDSFRKEFE